MNKCYIPESKSFSHVEQSTSLLNAVCEPNRIRILCVLFEHKICVCDLATKLNLANNLLSFHLKVLFEAGILDKKREGNKFFYSIKLDWQSRIEHFFKFIEIG